jgi:Na+-transporting methylmalonyl-CoA/oxaloacetate decarboxylase gamma subunit
MKEFITIMDALKITAICMGIVFITLYAISLIIGLFKIVFAEKKEKQRTVEVKKTNKEKFIGKLVADEEIVVAMTAAINMANEKKKSKFRIISVKELA